MRPVLRWHGGKWRLAPWIISHFPKHAVYVEPFGGAASVMLRKSRAIAEVYNDLDGDCVNLFRVLREKPAELIRSLALTPYAREEYDAAYADDGDDIDRARRFVARSFMGFSSKGAQRKNGFDARVNADHYVSRLYSLARLPDELAAIAGRFSRVIIEHREAIEIIEQYDSRETLLYCDPPYLPSVRYNPAVYRREMDQSEHVALLERLKAGRGMVAISGYPSELYDASLLGWRRLSREAFADGARPRTEVLWLNPACASALDDLHAPLFARAAE